MDLTFFSYVKYRCRLHKLISEQQKDQKDFDEKIRKAHKNKVKVIEIEYLRSEAANEFFNSNDFIAEHITNYLCKRARELFIPLPDYFDDKMWFESNVVTRDRLLTDKGIYELNSYIKKENWLRKNSISLLALLIAVVSAYLSTSQSEKSIKYSNRPYLVLNGIKEHSGKYRLLLSNFGSTPSYYTNIYYQIFEDDLSFSPPQNFTKIYKKSPTIGGNSKNVIAGIGHVDLFHYDTIQTLEAKGKCAFIAGKVVYKDIFNEEHQYFFCFQKNTDPGFSKFKDYNYPAELNKGDHHE